MVELIRDYLSLAGTHGTIALNGSEYHTIEKPDLGNLPYESCIPLGEYKLIPFDSPKFGSCFIMSNPNLQVFDFEDNISRPPKGRFLCLFVHRGNEIDNFVGCIGAGPSYDEERDRLNSSTTRTCRELIAAVHEEGSYQLNITHQFE